MRKLISVGLLVSALLVPIAFSGCGETGDDGTLDIVCTIFPQYDWTKNLTAGNDAVNIELLQDSGVDLHNYQATASDKVKIMGADLLIYVGGESDRWVEDILSDSDNPNRKIVKLLDEVDSLDEEDVPGAEEDHDHEEEEGTDEHVWLSLKRADKLVRAIAKALQTVDPANDVLYENNMHAYTEKISSLETEYSAAIQNAERKVLVFGDRFPFRYLVEDYDLDYFAAFSGCSAETEASFATIINLAKAIDEHSVPYVLVLENSDKKIANQIVNQTEQKNQQILEINSIQSVTRKQIDEGVDYISLMQENLETLKTALGQRN